MNFYVIIHGFKLPQQEEEVMKPFMHVTTSEEVHVKYFNELSEDILMGGGGKIYFAGEIDNIEMTNFWIMPFNK